MSPGHQGDHEQEHDEQLAADLARRSEEPVDATDERLLRELAEVLDTVDPVPGDLVQRVRFALALDELHAEVAEIVRTAVDPVAVRADPTVEAGVETITFTAQDLRVMVAVGSDEAGDGVRVDGWVSPAAVVEVVARRESGDRGTTSDETGRFVLSGLDHGYVQLVLRLGSRTVVTPAFEV